MGRAHDGAARRFVHTPSNAHHAAEDRLQTDADVEPSVFVLAEISLEQNVAIAEQLGGGHVVPVPTKTIVDQVMATAALSPTVGHVLQNFMSFVGSQLELVDALYLVDKASSYGAICTFGAVRSCFPRGIVLGVQTALDSASERSEGVGAPAQNRPLSAGPQVPGAETALHLVPSDDFVLHVRDSRAARARSSRWPTRISPCVAFHVVSLRAWTGIGQASRGGKLLS